MSSVLWFPKMESLLEHPILFSKNAEHKWTPHCVFQKCGVCSNCPPSCYKLQSPLELPALHLKNAEFVSTPHSIFTKYAVHLNPHCLSKKCRVYTNSSLWFLKMRSSHELPLCRVCLSSNSVFKKCGVQTNSPRCSPKMRSFIQLPTCFYKMRSLLELPTMPPKNAEFASTPHSAFYKMHGLLELSTLFLKNAEFTWSPSRRSPPELALHGVCLNSHSVFKRCGVQTNSSLCSPKMWSLFQLPILFLQNVESAGTPHCASKKCGVHSTPHCVFTNCAVCMNPPLSF